MVRWIVAVHDDDWSATAADIAATDFIDGESEVRKHPKNNPGDFCYFDGIRSITSALAATSADEDDGLNDAYVRLQPTNWADSEQMIAPVDVAAHTTEDTTTTDDHTVGWAMTRQYFTPYNMFVGKRAVPYGMDWINSGQSQIKGGEGLGTVNLSAILYFQSAVEPTYPTIGGPTVRIRKASGTATADVWSSIVKEELDDDGLDTDAMYRVLAGTIEPDAAQTMAMAWRLSVGGADWIGGIGNGTQLSGANFTVFDDDGIEPFRGDDEISIEQLCDQAKVCEAEIYFEQITAGRQTGGSPALAGQALRKSVPKAASRARQVVTQSFARGRSALQF